MVLGALLGPRPDRLSRRRSGRFRAREPSSRRRAADGSASVDAVSDLLERGGESLHCVRVEFGEDEVAHQCRVPRRGGSKCRATVLCCRDLTRASVAGCGLDLDEPPRLHAAQVMGGPGTFPANLGGKLGDPHGPTACAAQLAQHVIVVQREF